MITVVLCKILVVQYSQLFKNISLAKHDILERDLDNVFFIN